MKIGPGVITDNPESSSFKRLFPNKAQVKDDETMTKVVLPTS